MSAQELRHPMSALQAWAVGLSAANATVSEISRLPLSAGDRFRQLAPRASRYRLGDDARVRSRSPTAGADLRFARPAGYVATFEINGSRSSAVRVSSERHRRRLGRSLLAQPISALTAPTRCPTLVVHMQGARVHHR